MRLVLRYVSVGRLGHPDERCATIAEAKALCKRAVRKAIVVKEWTAPVEALHFGRTVWYSVAKWWKEGKGPEQYDGKLVCIYEPKGVRS